MPVNIAKAARAGSLVLSFDELAAKASTSTSWLIEGLLRESGLLLLAAQPKVGKSELARNAAKAIAKGGEFLGRRCRQGSVLWIGLEEPVPHLLDRIDVLGLKDLPINWVVEQPEGDEGAWLRAEVERHRPALVVIDTIGRFSRIEDINHYSQVARATQPLLDVRTEFGTSFIVIHHNNRSDGVLGSTQWEAVADSIMSLTRSPEGERFVKTTQRSGTSMESTRLIRDEDTGEITVAESKFIADQRAAEQRIMQYCRLRGKPATREELARHGGRSATAGRAAVDALLASGRLISSGKGTRRDPRLYTPANPDESTEVPKSPVNASVSSFLRESIYKDEEPDETRKLFDEPRGNPEQSPRHDEEPEETEQPEYSEETVDELFAYADDVIRA